MKIYKLLSIVLLAAFVLTACGQPLQPPRRLRLLPPPPRPRPPSRPPRLPPRQPLKPPRRQKRPWWTTSRLSSLRPTI
ncbi:MAG: hypothetical protein MZU97_08240 [Bacillus subtilis]|nr:hypothetical protein [Bacillus subtilis]